MPRKVWTAAEMEQMTRAEQQAIFDASIVTDLSKVPPEFLDRVRADALRLLETREAKRAD